MEKNIFYLISKSLVAVLLLYLSLCILTTDVAFCMDSGGLPSSSGSTSLLEPMPSTGESSGQNGIATFYEQDGIIPSEPTNQSPLNIPSDASSSKVAWWKKWFSCFTPQGEHSISSPNPIPDWIEQVDLPTEGPFDTINDLRKKCALLLESFSKSQKRDSLTWEDIAQRLVLEREKRESIGATKEDFSLLLWELHNPTKSDVYLRVLKVLEKYPR